MLVPAMVVLPRVLVVLTLPLMNSRSGACVRGYGHARVVAFRTSRLAGLAGILVIASIPALWLDCIRNSNVFMKAMGWAIFRAGMGRRRANRKTRLNLTFNTMLSITAFVQISLNFNLNLTINLTINLNLYATSLPCKNLSAKLKPLSRLLSKPRIPIRLPALAAPFITT